jgi:pimeloyl-ACP methyl ester carboxylesterase
MTGVTDHQPPLDPAGRPLDLEWRRTWIEDRAACYGVAGEGPTVVFLHGWLVGYRSYRAGISLLLQAGCRVFAPALPGFGGTAELPRRKFSMAGYADWLESFLGTVRFEGPALLVGHSFGGGVAIKTAERHANLAAGLLLINAVGGGRWRREGSHQDERPFWDWSLGLPGDIFPLDQSLRVLPRIAEEAVPNLIRSPRAIWQVAQMIRRTDLVRELRILRARGLPAEAVWSERDNLVPRASHDSLCEALGIEGQVLGGSHSWLLAEPDEFARLVLDMVDRIEASPATPKR